jgi:ATP-dependent Clp protease protease subunit
MDNIKMPLETPKERNLFFTSQVDQKTISSLTQDILEINRHDKYLKKLYKIHDLEYIAKPIQIYIDSYGGYIYQCFGLLSIMESSKTPIHTIATGAAMSCGFMILICGHKRFGYNRCTPMYHQASSGGNGKVKDLEEDLIETKRLQKMIEQVTLEKTKISKDQIKRNYAHKKDWFMTAEEALKLGVIDKIL